MQKRIQNILTRSAMAPCAALLLAWCGSSACLLGCGGDDGGSEGASGSSAAGGSSGTGGGSASGGSSGSGGVADGGSTAGGAGSAGGALDGGVDADGGTVDPDHGFGDWEPMPSTGQLDETDLGSRIAYISVDTGDDATGEYYYWDGEHVVDSAGTAYGDDPLNPSGPIKPFATFSKDHYRSQVEEERVSDWALFRRGEEFPPTGWLPGVGRSPDEPAYVGAYGPESDPRPRFDPNGDSFRCQANGRLVIANFVIRSVEVDARGKPADQRGGSLGAYMGINEENMPPAGDPDPYTWLWYEDVRVRGRKAGFVCQGWVKCNVNRSVVMDMWNPDAHNQGTYIGQAQPQLKVIDSVYYRNGYKEDPYGNPDPSRTIFDRNFYIGGGHNDKMSTHLDGVISAWGGSGAPQMRYGGTVEDCLIIEGYWFVSTTSNDKAASYLADQTGTTFHVHDNVQLVYKYDTPNEPGEHDARTHPGWGFNLGGASFGGAFERNIISGQYLTELGVGEDFGQYAISVAGNAVPADDGSTNYYPHDNVVRDNIMFDVSGFRFSGTSWGNVSGVEVLDNVWADRGQSNGITVSDDVPGAAITMSGNRFYTDQSNTFGGTGLSDWESAAGVTASGNAVSPLDQAASAEGWTDPNRSLKTYCEDVLGLTVTSPTGLSEFMELATENRLGSWDDRLTSRAVVNYIREGFGLPPI